MPTSSQTRHSIEARLGVVAVLLLAIGALVYFSYEKNVPIAAVQQISAVPAINATSDKEIVHGDTTKKQVIFTFDGGDSSLSSHRILKALAKHHVKGTFFLTGKFVQANPDLVRQMATSGNEIFSHTYSHPHLTTLSDAEIAGELMNMEHVLIAIADVSPRPYFRAPYGDRDARVIADVFKSGYESVYWTVDARDWMEPQGETNASVEDRILSNLAPGNIYLMHLGDNITGSILDDVFTKIENQGYKIVSLTQGL
jgi:peptidoglycan/xylan/chitin deacetylase (PgdA/CDA1 family)